MDEHTIAKIYNLIFIVPVLLMSLAIHEAAHAWSAYKLGDTTAKEQGRLTLNPLAHLDPLGTIFIIFAWLSGILFGWAKPVPVNPSRLREPFRDMALIAAAGPISNILQAFVWVGVLFVVKWIIGLGVVANEAQSPESFMGLFAFWGVWGILLNLFLAAFNMIPVPPLDGSRIAAALMPTEQRMWLLRLEPFGFIILIVLLQIGILDSIAQPVYQASNFMLQLVDPRLELF